MTLLTPLLPALFPVFVGDAPPDVPVPVPLAPPDGKDAVGPEGSANPVILPEKGPGIAVALASTPLRLGMGLPGSVPFVAIAASRNWLYDPSPVVGALMELQPDGPID